MYESSFCVKSPGKLILLGEYAVLEHAPALVTAIDRHCVVKISPLYNSTFQIRTGNLNLPEVQFTLDSDGDAHFRTPMSIKTEKQLQFVLSMLKYVTQRKGKIPGASIEIDTAPFYHKTTGHKFGLGSSAALTVSLLSALMEYMNKHIEQEDLYKEAFLAHRHAQGKLGSGTDIAASATGGVMSYKMPESIEKLNGQVKPHSWPEDLHMITIWAGYSASTRSFVNNVNEFRDNQPGKYDSIMQTMMELSEDGSKAFSKGDTDAFLNIVEDFKNQEYLLGQKSDTEIISDVHQEIFRMVKSVGGTYKPSGAGGGDIGVAFCKDSSTAERIRQVISESMFDVMDLKMNPTGTEVVHRMNIE
jgi:phosphomevalonate kinase